ncbi:MAG: GntR family transcriptional regulator [Deltaproteobacteria bacterium]|nr:GntR family transcriptional regulator [Deltaproteobacteria bacterium]
MDRSLFLIDISAEDPTPVYHQLEKAIQERIETGHLGVGVLIPPEREIAKMNGLSLATVRRALQNLVQNGFLHRIQGKGTFVSNTAQRRKKVRYYPLVRSFQDEIPQPNIKLIELNVVQGRRDINRHLRIRANQDLYELRRVISSMHKPMVYCISYLPYTLFKGLENYNTVYFEKYALYIFLEQEFGVSTMKNRELYGTALADKEKAEILDVKEGAPLLMVEMQALTHREKPYEYRVSYCRTDERRIRRVY